VFSAPSSRRIWRMAFEEGKRFDVADRAANLHDDDVHTVGDFLDDGFDFVGDVRDDLNGFAEVNRRGALW